MTTSSPAPAPATDQQGRAQEAASTAAGEGKHVAGVAKDEAKNVASEAATQARSVAQGVLRDVGGQVSEQSRTQQDRLGSTLRGLGDDLEKMAAQADSGLASDLAREAADRAHAVSQHLQGREPAELLDDVRRFARQRPGTFLLGALGAGVVAGRLLRGTKEGIEAAAAQQDTRTIPSLGTQPTATGPTQASTAATRAGVTGTVDPSLPRQTGTTIGGDPGGAALGGDIR